MSLRFHDTLKQRKQFFVTLHKLFKRTHLEGRFFFFFNRYFGLTKYHIYEESTSYPIIKKKERKESSWNELFQQTEGSNPKSFWAKSSSKFTLHLHARVTAPRSPPPPSPFTPGSALVFMAQASVHLCGHWEKMFTSLEKSVEAKETRLHVVGHVDGVELVC